MKQDMTVYFGVDGFFYEYKDVPDNIRTKVWGLLEEYRVKREESEMECPKCKSKNVERTCSTFHKDEAPKWTGWYCYDCGWWSIG